MRGQSFVHYSQAKWPAGLPRDLGAVFLNTFNQLGFPPPETPSWQDSLEGGSPGWLVDRIHYSAVVSCTFRDLERVVKLLHERLGLIAEHSPTASTRLEYPEAAEYQAVIMTQGNEFGGLGFEDRSGWRQILYQPFVDPEEFARLAGTPQRLAEMKAPDPDAVARAIRQVTAASDVFRSELARHW